LYPSLVDSFRGDKEDTGHNKPQVDEENLDEFGFHRRGEEIEVVIIVKIQYDRNDQYRKR
jgi:hypothetical protein